MTVKQERTKRVQIRISDEMYSRLSVVADQMGMALSTIASVALSEYVMKKEAEMKVMNDSHQALKEYLGDLSSTIEEKINQQ